MKKCLLGLLVVGFLTAADAKKPADDKAKLQGTWAVVAMEIEGRKVPHERVKSFTFDGDKITSQRKDGSGTGTFKLDPTQKPPHIDLIFDGKVINRMLYRLDGDMLKLNGDRKGEVRPKSYEAAAVIVTLKREKKNK
jgi:uncharacterized protein (TIGR03067 family)